MSTGKDCSRPAAVAQIGKQRTSPDNLLDWAVRAKTEIVDSSAIAELPATDDAGQVTRVQVFPIAS